MYEYMIHEYALRLDKMTHSLKIIQQRALFDCKSQIHGYWSNYKLNITKCTFNMCVTVLIIHAKLKPLLHHN